MYRLEHKYHGKNSQIMLQTEELQSVKTVSDGSSHDLEKLSELIDCLVVNLTEVGKYSELGGEALYRLCRENRVRTCWQNTTGDYMKIK